MNINIFKSTIFLVIVAISIKVLADKKFRSDYQCSDMKKHCVSSGERTIEGIRVTRNCWEWSYTKTCDYPSKNDCRLYEHCYPVADRDCLLRDSLGNCVNLKREFSCKSWEIINKENKEARVDLVAKDGKEGLVCKSIPCIDGNCVDKSYLTNGEMMDSISKLHMASAMRPDKDNNFNLFAGTNNQCSKKALSYSNCCADTAKGWGRHLGAECSKDEISLMTKRSKNLCVYVGKTKSETLGATIIVKHRYCCFSNILEKVVQVEGRKQLGLDFGSGSSPDCRGLTLEEITGYDKDGNKVGAGIDWSKIDFSEFINDLMVKFTGTYQTPNATEIGDIINNHMNINKYDGDEGNQNNNLSGVNKNVLNNKVVE